MSPGGRGTRTGKVHEKLIQQALLENYPGAFKEQVVVGNDLFGNKYKADFVLNDEIIMSAKWQQTRGTAEQKVDYEIITLVKILKENPKYKKAYIIISGTGYTKKAKDFYLNQKHVEYIKEGNLIEIISFEDFVKRSNLKLL